MGNQNVPKWSSYQAVIFAAVINILTAGRDLVILARAGTGKTTTVVEAIIRFVRENPGKQVLAVAFNKDAADELGSRFERAGFKWGKSGDGRWQPPAVQSSTLHSFGLTTVAKAFGWKKKGDHVDMEKGSKIARLVADEWRLDNSESDSIAGLAGKVGKLTERAKESLIDYTNEGALNALIWKYDIADSGEEAGVITALASKAMRTAKEDTTRVDGSDMIWFPHVHNLWPYRYDMVVVDEAQDMNPAQLSLARKAVKKGGRLVAVGDDRQAIYGWRGADSGFLGRLVEESGAQTLPLPETFRCGQRIVREAQEIVPDYVAFPANPEGYVGKASAAKMEAEAQAGDFIISRTNAPLMALYLTFLRDGKRAIIKGRDVMGSLIGLIIKSECESTGELMRWLSAYEIERAAQYAKAEASEEVIAAMVDKIQTLRVLAPEYAKCSDLVAFLKAAFTDVADEDVITLTTAHRSKGLERDRVWLLSDTFRADFGGEEANVLYVAITRARNELHYVPDVK